MFDNSPAFVFHRLIFEDQHVASITRRNGIVDGNRPSTAVIIVEVKHRLQSILSVKISCTVKKINEEITSAFCLF